MGCEHVAENQGSPATIRLLTCQQKFFLSYDMLEQRDVSLPYEEANPEAAKLERRGSMENSRKVSGKQIGSGSAES